MNPEARYKSQIPGPRLPITGPVHHRHTLRTYDHKKPRITIAIAKLVMTLPGIGIRPKGYKAASPTVQVY